MHPKPLQITSQMTGEGRRFGCQKSDAPGLHPKSGNRHHDADFFIAVGAGTVPAVGAWCWHGRDMILAGSYSEPLGRTCGFHCRYDLYTKSDEKPDAKALWPYYQGLIGAPHALRCARLPCRSACMCRTYRPDVIKTMHQHEKELAFSLPRFMRPNACKLVGGLPVCFAHVRGGGASKPYCWEWDLEIPTTYQQT